MGLPGSLLARQAARVGSGFIPEMFADRRYEDDGSLTPRTDPRALIETLDEALAQVASVRDTGLVRTRTGRLIPLRAATVCVHGDSPAALSQARALARLLRGSDPRGMVEGA
jgi:5-oxoprolinase (ATP-hydrolysing) subunit A